jgi:ABC-type bacteriocin/lantibiotic exporter with double-glycine peptidase domain
MRIYYGKNSLGEISHLKKTFTAQQDQSDCGVACLLSIIRYHGGDTTLEELRERSGTSVKGTTLLGLYQSAMHYGFNAEGYEANNVEDLKQLKEPTILHVVASGLQHYFVFYGVTSKGDIIIGDPAKGVITFPQARLEKLWETKALLKLTPNEDFTKKQTRTIERRRWIKNLVKEDLGILGTALFLGIIITVLGLSTAVFSQKLIDVILPSGDTQKLILSLTLVAFILLARSGLSYLRGFFLITQAKEINSRIIQTFYSNLLRLPKSFFDTRKIGELIARMNDTRRIQTMISIVSGGILIDLLVLLVATVFILIYSGLLGLIVLSTLPVFFLLSYFFNGAIVNSQKEVMSAYAATESNYVDSMTGIGTIKAFNRESFFETCNKRIYGLFQERIFKLGKLNIRLSLFSELIGIAFILIMFGFSSWMVITQSLTSGELVALLGMSATIIPSISRIAAANIQIQEARVAFDRMYEFTSIKPENDLKEIDPAHHGIDDELHLQIRNLNFGFPGRKLLLRNISLEVKSREFVAIIGESGGGKSTLIQILQKFYQSSAGKIDVNGVSLTNILTKDWRTSVSVVPQEIKIFNGNLLYNLTLSESQDDYKLVEVFCEYHGFDRYFKKFPQSYLTILGEEGVNISGGQKQLVALARALFRKPKLLLLDEATASMDRNTEDFVFSLLSNLKSEIAVMAVTHRMKLASHADRIYVLEDGEICFSGSPNELMSTKNLFSDAMKELTL